MAKAEAAGIVQVTAASLTESSLYVALTVAGSCGTVLIGTFIAIGAMLVMVAGTTPLPLSALASRNTYIDCSARP